MTARLTFRANGDANSFALLDADTGNWFMSLLVNGQQMEAKQVENLRRLAATWNACDGIPTEALERVEGDTTPVFELLMQTTRERDVLLRALTAIAQSAPDSTVLGLQQTAASAITVNKPPPQPTTTNMTTTHTPGRLQVPEPYDGQYGVIVENDCGRYAVAVSIRNPADARRLAACWNVCDGMDTELLESILCTGETMLTRFQARDHADEIIIADRLRFMQERDKLRTAMNNLLNAIHEYEDGDYYMDTDAAEVIAEANRVSIETAEPAPPPDTTITTNSVCGKPGHTCNWVDTQPSGSKCTICGETTPF